MVVGWQGAAFQHEERLKKVWVEVFGPGRKPGTSTKVIMGKLNASQKRTKRAALIDESMSFWKGGRERILGRAGIEVREDIGWVEIRGKETHSTGWKGE